MSVLCVKYCVYQSSHTEKPFA
ncbi:rCG49041, partial [Rattus norvegicus]